MRLHTQPFSTWRSLVWLPILLCVCNQALARNAILHDVPYDAPQEVVLDHARLLSPEQEQSLEKEALNLTEQTGIRLWIITLPAGPERETRRAVTRRVHTWVNRGLGLVLGLSADPNTPPRLGVSQDLLVELAESDLRKMRQDILTAWEEEAESSRKPLAATRAVSGTLDLYRIAASEEQDLPSIFGLNSRQFSERENPSGIRGRYRESMEREREWEQEFRDASEMAQTDQPELPPRFFETLAWRTRVWIINLALLAVIASGAIWLFLHRVAREKARQQQMEEGARQLTARRPQDAVEPEKLASRRKLERESSPQQVDSEDVY
jgi:hypothetical protein